MSNRNPYTTWTTKIEAFNVKKIVWNNGCRNHNCISLSPTCTKTAHKEKEAGRHNMTYSRTERQMEAEDISSALFNQTVRSGGEEMAAVCFTTAAIDLHCSLSNQSQSGGLQTICECIYELCLCLPKAILLRVSKWQKALALHLTTAGPQIHLARHRFWPGSVALRMGNVSSGSLSKWDNSPIEWTETINVFILQI